MSQRNKSINGGCAVFSAQDENRIHSLDLLGMTLIRANTSKRAA